MCEVFFDNIRLEFDPSDRVIDTTLNYIYKPPKDYDELYLNKPFFDTVNKILCRHNGEEGEWEELPIKTGTLQIIKFEPNNTEFMFIKE